ncbi:MAG: LPS export ABC transporter periplasmic protein LptC [Candidatus Omnitrophica bacterium]|nr:LPS export ABC transporter periplasmic protein LptC [Candidatus Omnitrophota bacterium]
MSRKNKFPGFRPLALGLSLCFSAALPLSEAFAWGPRDGEYDYEQRMKEDRIRAGKVYYDAKKYEKAIEMWEQALEIDPQDRKIPALLESAKKRLEIEAKPAVTRQEREQLKKLEAERKAQERLEAQKRRAEEAEREKAEREAKLEEARRGREAEKEAAREAPKAAAEEKAAPAPEEAPKPAVPEEAPAPEEALKPVAEEAAAPSEEEKKMGEEPVKVEVPSTLEEPIVVNGDRVEYYQEKKQVVGTGGISITYKDIVMTCDKITVYLDSKDAIAEGNVKITQKGATFTGDTIKYNFDTRVGDVVKGDVSAKPFYGKADRIEKLSDKEIRIDNGYVTTCDLPNPHYRIQAKQVRIYTKDKVIAKNVFFYVGKIPILYFPYYIQPLTEHSAHATALVGRDKDWGYYGLSSIRYYFNKLFSGKLRLDYRTKKGLAVGFDNYYSIKGLGNGSVKLYGIDENDSLAFEKSGEREFKYRAQVRHRWEVTKDTLMMLEFNKMRDQYFIRDYFLKEYEEEGPVPDNYISFITAKRDYTTQLLLRKRMDKYFNVVERLPEYSIDIHNYRFGESKLYFKSHTSGAYLNEKYPATVPEQKDFGSARFDSYNQLSYAEKLFGFWNITPYVGMRQTYYSRNLWGDTNLIRGIFNTGVDNYMRFYKTWDVQSNFMNMDIHSLRHLIMPGVNYYYTHQPTIAPENLNQFDDVDAIDTANGFLLSLENKLQTKRYQGEDLKTVDLVRFIVSSDYMFRLKKNNLELKSNKFRSVDFQLELYPYPWLYSISKMMVNTKHSNIESASVDLTAVGGKKWSLGAGYRYENAENTETNLITAEVSYQLTDKWKINVYEQFDINKAAFIEQEYTVYRDLHCWIAEFSYDIKSYCNDHTFWFALRLKAFPQLPLGLRTTYSRAHPGALQNLGRGSSY